PPGWRDRTAGTEIVEAARERPHPPQCRAGLGVERIDGAVRVAAPEYHQWHALGVDAVRVRAPRSGEDWVRVPLPLDLAGCVVDGHHRTLSGPVVLYPYEEGSHTATRRAHHGAGEVDSRAKRELALHVPGVRVDLDHPAAYAGANPQVIACHG